MATTNRVFIFDTTLRDGEQAPGCSMTTPEKVRMAGKLAELGVDIMEAGFPIASTGDFEAVQAVSRVVPVKIAALARCTALDIERAAQALDKAKTPPRIHTFLATSDIHLKYKLKKTRAQVLEDAAKAVELARKYVDDVEFSAEDGGRTEAAYLIDVSRAVVAAGASTVNIPDTVGYAIPEEYGVLIGQVARAIGDKAIVSVHCHNDLGLAVANSLAAVQNGARQIECTVNGIGERAGNASLEEIAMAIRVRADAFEAETGIDPAVIRDASALVCELTGYPVALNKPIVGANAFAHEAGIHQDGMLKDAGTYQIIDPRELGTAMTLPLGKHSGRHAFALACAEAGHAVERSQLDSAFRRFKELADLGQPVSLDQVFQEVPA
jgi:2-isopropylmalate synthase